MPQMAPMMWQIIFLSCILMMVTSVCKNFFSTVSIKKSDEEMMNEKNEMNWKW